MTFQSLGTIRDGKKCPLNEGVASVKEYVPGSWEAFNIGTKIYVLGITLSKEMIYLFLNSLLQLPLEFEWRCQIKSREFGKMLKKESRIRNRGNDIEWVKRKIFY